MSWFSMALFLRSAGACTPRQYSSRESPPSSLTPAEGDHWVGTRGAPCRNITRDQRHEREGKGHAKKGGKVECAHLIEHRAQERGGKECDDQTENCPGADQDSGMRDDEADHIRALCAKSHPHSDLVRSLHDEERHHAVDAD